MNAGAKTYLKYYLKGRNTAKRVTRFGAKRHSYKVMMNVKDLIGPIVDLRNTANRLYKGNTIVTKQDVVDIVSRTHDLRNIIQNISTTTESGWIEAIQGRIETISKEAAFTLKQDKRYPSESGEDFKYFMKMAVDYFDNMLGFIRYEVGNLGNRLYPKNRRDRPRDISEYGY